MMTVIEGVSLGFAVAALILSMFSAIRVVRELG